MKYGMKYRGFSPGAQPMKGFVRRHDAEPGQNYHDVLEYDRELTEEEIRAYELEAIETQTAEDAG